MAASHIVIPANAESSLILSAPSWTPTFVGVTRKCIGAFATYPQPELAMNGLLSDGSSGNGYAARIIHHHVESPQ
jgi:hypothetical protein